MFHEQRKIIEFQIVTRVHTQPEILREMGGVGVFFNRGFVAARECGGVGFGVQLDAISAKFSGPFHLQKFRVEEQTHAAAMALQCFYDRAEALHVRLVQIPAVIAGRYILLIGHERALRGANFLGEVHEFVERIAFDVELGGGV